MSTNIQIFNHPEFGNVRTIGDFENPRFCLADVCRILELPQVAKVVQRLNKDVLSTHPLETAGGVQEMYFVNEDGLYDVILDSRKPNAKKFRKWITSEVIPSIRKTGVYMTTKAAEEILSNPDFIISLAQQVKDANAKIAELGKKNTELTVQVTEQAQQLEEQAPKVSYYDTVLQSPDLVPVTIIFKDYGVSAITGNRILEKKGIQYKINGTWVLKQEYSGLKWTQTKTHVYQDKSGKEHTKQYTCWTQLGRLGIYNLLKKDNILSVCEQPEDYDIDKVVQHFLSDSKSSLISLF